MATSGFRSDDGDNKKKWPLEYVRETEEYICGWCGQLLNKNQTLEYLEKHFGSCKSSKENAFLMGFKEVRKLNQKFEGLGADMQTRMDQMKAEVIEVRAEFNENFEDLKSDMKKNLEAEIDLLNNSREAIDASLLSKLNTLEKGTKEKMGELGLAQDTKMAEVNAKLIGVTDTISTAVNSLLEKVTSADSLLSNELDRSKKETEVVWVQLRKSEEDIQTTKTQMEKEVAHLKTGLEAVSGQLKTNDRDIQIVKRQMEDGSTEMEAVKQLAKKKGFNQMTIPMNSFNLVTHNYLFQPSFRWTIDDIKTRLRQKTFELNSEMFQWNGYPVQARAKLQLKEDDYVYISLCLKDESKPYDFTLIPCVHYLLKDINARNPKHKSIITSYLFTSAFNYSLEFEQWLARKSWFSRPEYNVDDSIEIEIYVESPSMSQLVHSYDGTLEWSMENYTRRLQLEKEGLVFHQESPYFYTGPRGYKAQVEMYLNGYGGKGLTAAIVFVTGRFDAELPQSFPHSTTVTLVNPKEPERSINKNIVEDIKNKRYYNFEICKLEEVDNVIENDTLFCKVVIESSATTD